MLKVFRPFKEVFRSGAFRVSRILISLQQVRFRVVHDGTRRSVTLTAFVHTVLYVTFESSRGVAIFQVDGADRFNFRISTVAAFLKVSEG